MEAENLFSGATKQFLKVNAEHETAIMNFEMAHRLLLRTKVICSIGATVLIGGVSTGAGFGYHYLSNFLFDYIPSRLYGN